MTTEDLRAEIASYLEHRGAVSMDQIDGHFNSVEFIDLVEALADLEGTGQVEFVEQGDGAFRLRPNFD